MPWACAGAHSFRHHRRAAERYLEKDGQDGAKGSLKPIQCYGKRGPIKKMDTPAIKAILKGEL